MKLKKVLSFILFLSGILDCNIGFAIDNKVDNNDRCFKEYHSIITKDSTTRVGIFNIHII